MLYCSYPLLTRSHHILARAGEIVSPAKPAPAPPSISASSTHISSSRQTTTTSIQQPNDTLPPSLRVTLNRPELSHASNSAGLPAPATRLPAAAASKVMHLTSSPASEPSRSPPPKARPKARRLPKPVRQPSPALEPARPSSADEMDLLPPLPHLPHAHPAAPQAGPSGSQGGEGSCSNRTVPSSPLSTPAEPASSPAVGRQKNAGAAGVKRRVRATSEDGELDEGLQQAKAANERLEDEDSDFDVSQGKKGKGKGKAAKGKAAKGKKAKAEPKTKVSAAKGKRGVKGKAVVVEPEPEPEAEVEAMEVVEEPVAATAPVASTSKAVKAKSDRRMIVESDEDEDEDGSAAGPAASAAKTTPVPIKPTDPTTKPRTSATKAKEPSFVIEVPVAHKRPPPARAAKLTPPAVAPARAKGRSKQKAAVADSEDDDGTGGAFDSDAASAILTGDESSDSDAPPSKKKAVAAKGKKGVKPSLVAARKAGSPVVGRGRRLSLEEREAAVLRAAEEEVAEGLVGPAGVKGKGKGGSKVPDDEAEDADSEEGKDAKDEDEIDKENAGSAKVSILVPLRYRSRKFADISSSTMQPVPPKPSFSTPSALSKSAARPRPATPGSAFATPRPAKGIGRILHKLSNSGLRAPGLSARAKIPPLHANLKAAPKARPVVPQAKVRPKKGAKEYGSDEEAPWWETKPHEEWDSEDGREYAKVLKKRERGWSSD